MFRRVMIRIFRHGKSGKLTVRPLRGSNGMIGGSGTGFLSGYVADFRFRAKANSRPPGARSGSLMPVSLMRVRGAPRLSHRANGQWDSGRHKVAESIGSGKSGQFERNSLVTNTTIVRLAERGNKKVAPDEGRAGKTENAHLPKG
jgi:hypothetical protein